MKKLIHSVIIKEILENVREDMDDEEIIHLVLEKTVSLPDDNNITKSQKLADKLARVAGSWVFIIIFVILLLLWMILNLIFPNSIDPYPFILLNLILSCLSAIQAPIIMMSQNRQAKKDQIKNENDYKVNLKNEIIIQDLHSKLDQILEELAKLDKSH